VSPVNDSVVWVGGHGGVMLRTLDGGRTWIRLQTPGGDSLQFRDVHAVGRDSAYTMSAGPGERSRIYWTADGGETWQRQFLNRDSSGFYDCFDFWDARHGIAMSDAVDGRLVVIATADGGRKFPLENRNLLIGRYRGAIGVKTGFTASAGKCLVALAEREGIRVLLVLLNAPDRWWKAEEILDAAFARGSGASSVRP